MCNHVYEKNTKKASLRVGACALVFVQRGERAQLRDHPPNLELIKAQLSARPTAPPPFPMRNVCCTTRSKEREETNHTYFLCYMWYSSLNVNYKF